MRGVLIVYCGLILLLLGIGSAAAQDFSPPPGFAPGEDEAAPAPPAVPPKTFAESEPLPRRSIASRQDADPRPTEIFSQPEDPYAPYPPPGAFLFPADATPLPRFWFSAEALYWWTESSPVPVPLVTRGNPSDSNPGALGQPGTSVIMGNESIALPSRGGARFTLGFSLDPEQTLGLEGNYFSLANASASQGVTSYGGPGSAFLAIPFFNPNTSAEDASPLAAPGYFAGTAVVEVQSFLQGAELNLIKNLQNASGVRFGVIGGFRYVNLREKLTFSTSSPSVPPYIPDYFQTYDAFTAQNNFYGGQIGARVSYDYNRLYWNAVAKVALGGTVESVNVNGGTYTNAGGYFVAPGGYFSQPTNMGTQSRTAFAVVPEVDLNFGVRLTPRTSIFVGYSFLYISSVARPGNQIDRTINPTQSSAISGNFPATLSGPARPTLNLESSGFWAQGINFGLQFRY